MNANTTQSVITWQNKHWPNGITQCSCKQHWALFAVLSMNAVKLHCHRCWCGLGWDLVFRGDTVHHTLCFYHLAKPIKSKTPDVVSSGGKPDYCVSSEIKQNPAHTIWLSTSGPVLGPFWIHTKGFSSLVCTVNHKPGLRKIGWTYYDHRRVLESHDLGSTWTQFTNVLSWDSNLT